MLSDLRAIVGGDAVDAKPSAAAYAIADMHPSAVVLPGTVDELCRCIAAIGAAGGAVVPTGVGARLHVGRPPRRYDVALSTHRLLRVLEHEAADMTVHVGAGMTLAELNAELGQAGQHLPLDPAWPERTTIGGLIAANASGPWRLSQGTVRDLLIGITVALADGTLVRGGGRVVKNVAGYDLMKLFTGSYGTLGIIVDATFKVRPRPEREALVVLPASTTTEALSLAAALLAAPLEPRYVTVVNGNVAGVGGVDGPAALLGCGGLEEEIAVQVERARVQAGGREVRVVPTSEAERAYTAMRDWPPLQHDSVLRGRVSLLPGRLVEMLPGIEQEAARHGLAPALLAHVGSGVASFTIAATDVDAVVAFAEWLRAGVRERHGWAMFDRVPAPLVSRVDPWGMDVPGLELMRGIKRSLDPHDRLSPGRFVGGI